MQKGGIIMNNYLKRTLAIVLGLVLCISNTLVGLANGVDDITVSTNDVSVENVSENALTPLETGEKEDLDGDTSIYGNSSYASAYAINVNQAYTGRISQDDFLHDKEDYYVFSIPADGYIQIEFSHEIYESDNNGYEINLERNDSDHTVIENFLSGNGYTQSAASGQIGLPAGTYYLHIADYSYEVCDKNYTVKVNYVASSVWETEDNNSWLSADPIALNMKYYGSILYQEYSYEAEDYFAFSLPRNGYIQIEFSHPLYESNEKDYEITVYKNDANHTIIERFMSSDGYTASISSGKIGLPAGSYYLSVNGDYRTWQQTYSFTVRYTASNTWETEQNDSWLSADPIQVNTLYYGTILNYEQTYNAEDYFKFSIPYTTCISVYFQQQKYNSSNAGYEISICDSSHEILGRMDSPNGYKEDITGLDMILPAGEYYLLVNGDYNVRSLPYAICINMQIQTPVGTIVNIGGMQYKVTENGGFAGRVTCMKPLNKNKTAYTIPRYVTISGMLYFINGINKNAFKNCKKMKKITINGSVEKIGSQAFYGCKNLKQIVIKSSFIKSVGKNALKGINKKAVIKVPKSKLKSYQKKFKKKGQKSSVKIKKL